ncbi:MAG: DUF559 domain-containing protein [Planctomycetota bacterium]
MTNEKRVPHAKQTLQRARTLRRRMTEPERRLWSRLRDRRCAGFKFRRQVPIGPYIADFICEAVKLVVEVDGLSHVGRQGADAARTQQIEEKGYAVLRVTNDDVLREIDAVLEHIVAEAKRLSS